MSRRTCAIHLLSLAVLALGLCSCGDEGAVTTVAVEKRIVLLDRKGDLAGRYIPDEEKIPKLFRMLGREKRPFFTVSPGRSARFDGLPIHDDARLVFYVGTEKAGRVGMEIRAETMESGGTPSMDEVLIREDLSEPGWKRCEWPIPKAFLGKKVRMHLIALEDTPGGRVIVGDPVLLSAGCREPLDRIPPLLFEDEVRDLLDDFDQAEQVTSDPERPLSRTVLRFDPEKRTVADDAKKGIRAAPESEFFYEVEVPDHAYLDVAVFILPKGNPKTALDSGNVEFVVSVDRTPCVTIRSDYINADNEFINLYEKLIHRERIDLSPWKGRRVEIHFRTQRTDDAVPADGEYAWWDLKLGRNQRLPRTSASAKDPNVLVLCIDALRADHLGCYGYERATSGNLDAFAARSLLFENAISPCSWTLPATASLLTGLNPNTHGVLGNTRNYLVDGITTLAEFLIVQGITTAAFTANELVCAAINFDQGFEHFVEMHDACAGRMNDDLIAWMESCGPNRFFAYVHYMEPHSPYSAPGRFRQHFDPDYVERRDFSGPLPEKWRLGQVEEEFTDDEVRHLVDLYDSEIFYWDHEFKRLLETLDSLKIADRTLIIVTADHGEEFFDHGGLGHGITLFQEVIHVPLILFDPRMKNGGRIDDCVCSASLFSTLSDRLGLETPGFVQIPSLFPLDRIESRFPAIYSSTERNQEDNMERWASVIEPPLKRITGMLGAGEMLFDLTEDPLEQNNLLDAHHELGEELKAKILDWYRTTAEAFPDEWQPLSEEILEKLRDIGYIGGK